MINWEQIRDTLPEAFSCFSKWVAGQYRPFAVNIELSNLSGDSSPFHLRVSVMLPENPKSKKKVEPIKVLQFPIRDLYDFFDDQGMDVQVIPFYRTSIGSDEKNRGYYVTIGLEDTKIYPNGYELMGKSHPNRREAESFMFYKAFEVLESNMKLTKV